jgi:hypothetical protein
MRKTSRRRTDTGFVATQALIAFATAAAAVMGLSSSRFVAGAVMPAHLKARGLITQPNC